jgi:hypothetical protein
MTSVNRAFSQAYPQTSIIDPKSANDFGAKIKPDVKVANALKAVQTVTKLIQYWPAICAAIGTAGTAWQHHDDFANIISGESVQSKKDLTRFVRQILSSPVAGTMQEDWQKNMQNYVMKWDENSTLEDLKKERQPLQDKGQLTPPEVQRLKNLQKEIDKRENRTPNKIQINTPNIATPAVQIKTGVVDEKPVTVLKAESNNDDIKKKVDARKKDQRINRTVQSRRKANKAKRKGGGYNNPK